MHTTENLVQMTEKLKREIWENYNMKANILGPTACAMAMQIDLSKQLNKSKGQGHPAQVGMGTTPALRNEIKDATGPTFKPVLMYGGQGEYNQCIPNNIRPTYNLQGHTGDAATPSVLSVEGHTGQAPPEECRYSVSGLDQPRLRATGVVTMSINKKKLRAENQCQRQAMQWAQSKPMLWMHYTGNVVLPQGADDKSRPAHKSSMCPAGLALYHPAAEMLLDWAKFGCPMQTGKPWAILEMEEAIARGPHQSALTPEAREHFAAEIKEKVRSKQARVVEWDTIKNNPPSELKILPIEAIPHKLKAYWLILDLSF